MEQSEGDVPESREQAAERRLRRRVTRGGPCPLPPAHLAGAGARPRWGEGRCGARAGCPGADRPGPGPGGARVGTDRPGPASHRGRRARRRRAGHPCRPGRRRRWAVRPGSALWVWATVVLIAALTGALIGAGIVDASDHSAAGATVKVISAGPALLNGTTDIESVIDKVLPAVVSIDAKSTEPASEAIFGGGSGGVQEDQGTGMIITPTGEVVTNNHVIAGATTITVTLYGSLKALPATLIDTDPANDVALLQIDGRSNLPTVSFGNSDNLQVGDAVVAIGNALGLSAGTPTVTQGIISAKGRTVQAGDSSGTSTETLSNMLQTDAAINPGNSGGPLVDSSGMVIGMDTAVASSIDGTAQAQDIGFAIPSDKITQLLPDLRNRSIGNDSQRGSGYLGVEIETLTNQVRSAYNFFANRGAVVLQVEAGSPAVGAGIHQGDVIVSLDGKTVTSADQLGAALQADKPGQRVTIVLYRGQNLKTVTATLGSTSEAPQSVG